ncbi:RHS repeat-associated core domain-containing protein [Streptomyces sp. NPDC057148]|uniref:RHS repeat-associated core domain-containing protein n=1 Tax=unclassified Streptomyces TaxID=2593676 RepID=UPI00362EA490
MTTGGKSYYYLTDATGNVLGLVDDAGKRTHTYAYGPTGLPRTTPTEIVPLPYRYAGAYADPTGLYKMGHRYYDPTLGRLTQPDPSGQETNPYLYAAGDPVNLVDPTGLLPIPDVPDWLKSGAKKVGSVFGKYSKPAGVIGLACYINNSVRDDDPGDLTWQNLKREAGQALSCQSNWAAWKF